MNPKHLNFVHGTATRTKSQSRYTRITYDYGKRTYGIRSFFPFLPSLLTSHHRNLQQQWQNTRFAVASLPQSELTGKSQNEAPSTAAKKKRTNKGSSKVVKLLDKSVISSMLKQSVYVLLSSMWYILYTTMYSSLTL